MDREEEAAQLREQVGRTGAWFTALGIQPAAVERDTAAEIERLGYGSLWFGETEANKEAFAHAGLLLAATDRLVIGTGIANIWVRDATAMTAGRLALAEAYPGRFVNGIGVSHAPLIERRGHDYRRPLAAMDAYLDGMEESTYRGPAPPDGEPIVLAALRPKMLALSRERTTGAHTYFVTPEHSARARAILGPEPFLVPEQAVVLETDPEKAREIARGHMQRYLALPNYVNNLRDLGFGDGDFTSGGSDALADAIVAWGDEDAIVARVREHLDAGADHVVVQPVVPDFDAAREQLRALAPALTALPPLAS